MAHASICRHLLGDRALQPARAPPCCDARKSMISSRASRRPYAAGVGRGGPGALGASRAPSGARIADPCQGAAADDRAGDRGCDADPRGSRGRDPSGGASPVLDPALPRAPGCGASHRRLGALLRSHEVRARAGAARPPPAAGQASLKLPPAVLEGSLTVRWPSERPYHRQHRRRP